MAENSNNWLKHVFEEINSNLGRVIKWKWITLSQFDVLFACETPFSSFCFLISFASWMEDYIFLGEENMKVKYDVSRLGVKFDDNKA